MSNMKEIAFTKAKLPFGWLGNMTSQYPVVYNELQYPSTEALFQALRFPEDSPLREEIRLEKNPFKGKLIAKANRDKMSIEPCGEEDFNNMRLCIELKIEQHSDLKEILIESGNLPIYEDVTSRGRGKSNLIWGALKEKDGTWVGQNILGNLWMELRAKLRGETTEVETERRFLLTMVPNIVVDDAIMMTQYYTSEKDANKVERVRCSQRDGSDPKLVYTAKERISDMSVNETEREISQEEWDELKPNFLREITKTRWIKNMGDLKWEIDEFIRIKLVIAEIELPSENYDLVIPEWLKPYIIMEVTGIKEFSNSNLAQ